MNGSDNQVYDAGYLACIKDVKATIKQLIKEYDKGIPISILQDEIKSLHMRYLAFKNK